MHYLQNLIKEIDKTHPHLGNLAAMCQLSIKAKKLLLVVSPRGCGKSRISSFIGAAMPGASLQDRLSVAGLGFLKEEFNGFQSVVVVDDIAKCQTSYARITTITTLGELVYSHYCKSALIGTVYNIENFYGSAIVNVQPVLLKELVKSDEWEASIQDKSIRYYHLYRPQEPNSSVPEVEIQWGKSLDSVAKVDSAGKLLNELKVIGSIQWGLARTKEHISDLLRAAAALDNRDKVTQADLAILLKIIRPLSYEGLIGSKTAFESERNINSNLLAILTEYVTYGKFTLAQIAQDYKLSLSQCYRIMQQCSLQWTEVTKSPTSYAPSADFLKELVRIGLVK